MQTLTLSRTVIVYKRFPGCDLFPTSVRLPRGSDVVLGNSFLAKVNDRVERVFPLCERPGPDKEYVLFKDLEEPDLVE